MQTNETSNHRSVPAVSKSIAIMRLLGRCPNPMGINQVARELGFIPSTCLHILRVLAAEQLVAFDPETKRYSLGLGLLTMARSVISKNDFAGLVQPHLTRLSIRFGITLIGVQMADRAMVVVALSQAALPFRLQVDLGSRFPALISASGRCYAAFGGLSNAELLAGFSSLRWDHPPNFEEWLTQLEATRVQGYGIDREQYIAGVTILSVPFFDRIGRMSHALVASGITERITNDDVRAIAAEMIRIRDEVSELLVASGTSNGSPVLRRTAC